MLRIESLEIDDSVLDKIESKHGVSFEEMEETCVSDKRHARRGTEGLYKLFGCTEAGKVSSGGSRAPTRQPMENCHS